MYVILVTITNCYRINVKTLFLTLKRVTEFCYFILKAFFQTPFGGKSANRSFIRWNEYIDCYISEVEEFYRFRELFKNYESIF